MILTGRSTLTSPSKHNLIGRKMIFIAFKALEPQETVQNTIKNKNPIWTPRGRKIQKTSKNHEKLQKTPKNPYVSSVQGLQKKYSLIIIVNYCHFGARSVETSSPEIRLFLFFPIPSGSLGWKWPHYLPQISYWSERIFYASCPTLKNYKSVKNSSKTKIRMVFLIYVSRSIFFMPKPSYQLSFGFRHSPRAILHN